VSQRELLQKILQLEHQGLLQLLQLEHQGLLQLLKYHPTLESNQVLSNHETLLNLQYFHPSLEFYFQALCY